MSPKDDAQFDLHAEEVCWAQWFAGCTIERCEPDPRKLLADKGRANFRRWLAVYGAKDSCADVVVGERPWCLFEEHMLANGKHYKNWLRAVVDSDPNRTVTSRIKVLNSTVNRGLFRTVVRQWVMGELDDRDGAGKSQGNIAEPSPDENGQRGWDWESFASAKWTGASEATAEKETLAMVEACLPDVVALMTRTLRVAMAAKLTGVSLANEGLEPFAGVKRSQIDASLKTLAGKLCAVFTKRYPGEGEDQVLSMQLVAIQFLMTDNEEWLQKPENGKLLRFLRIEGKKYETF